MAAILMCISIRQVGNAIKGFGSWKKAMRDKALKMEEDSPEAEDGSSWRLTSPEKPKSRRLPKMMRRRGSAETMKPRAEV